MKNKAGHTFISVGIVGALLAGCAPTPDATPSPVTPATTASAEPEAVPVDDRPSTRFALSCPEIGALADFGAMFSQPVTAQDALSLTASQGLHIRGAVVDQQQYGGLVCEWSIGAPDYAPNASDTVLQNPSVSVMILPDAAAGFADKKGFEFGPGDGNYCDPFGCDNEYLVGEYWVRVRALGSEQAAMTAFTAAVQSRVDQLDPSTPRWAPRTETRMIGASCEDSLTVAEVEQILGATGLSVSTRETRYTAQEQFAATAVGDRTCDYSGSEEFSPRAILSVLPEGAWAVEDYANNPELPFPTTPVEVAGLGPSDTARLSCAGDGGCTILMALGGNWVQIEASGDEAQLRALANAIVKRIGPSTE